jgi:DNA polymerase-1
MSLYGGVTIPGQPDLENVRRLDLLPVPMILKMQRYGVAIDREYLWELSSDLGHEMTELERDIASYIPPDRLHWFSDAAASIEETQGLAELNANSAEQIRTLLFDLLKVGSGRQLKVTDSGRISTGKKQLELCRDDHPVVAKVLEYRERSKLKSAFADSLPKRAVLHPAGSCCPVCELRHAASTWRVHGEFTTTRTETGRLSMRKPNLQQVPQRTELGAKVRLAFIAPPGRKLVSVDFSQIELRDLAHLSQCESMMRTYHHDCPQCPGCGLNDIHTTTAMEVFGIADPLQVDKLYQRLPCKNVNFMIVYGAGAKGLQAQLALSGIYWTEEECERFIRRWFSTKPEVGEWIGLQSYRAHRYGFVWDPFGRVRRVPETRSCHGWIRAAGIRQAGNMPIQSVSAGQTKLAMGELDELLEPLENNRSIWPLLSIHDQLIYEADEDVAEELKEIMISVFAGVMNGEWSVPIDADGEIMDRWKKE